jgi:hypothetical protein
MLSPSDLSHKVGQKLLYVGLESFTWGVADYTKAAQNARALGFDTLIFKAADGGNRWYSSIGDLVAKRNAVLQQGVGCMFYTYLYGPRFGPQQIQMEAAIAKEIQDNCGGLVVLDMEVEWNGQEGSAALLASYLKAFNGDVLVTTWADPKEQNWIGVLKQLNPYVSAWMPQVYTTFLDGAEAEFKDDADIDLSKVFPVVDIADLFANANPIAILADAVKRGQQSIAVWEYGAMLSNVNLVKSLLNLLPKINLNLNGSPSPSQPSSPVVTVAPHPTASNPTTAPVTLPNPGTSVIRYGKYTIANGDTLESIAAKLHIANWYQDLFLPNKVTLDAAAKAHGNVDSQKGGLIYAGTVLSYPIILTCQG